MSKFTEYLEGTKPKTTDSNKEIWIQFLLNIEDEGSLEKAITPLDIKRLERVKEYIEARKNLVKIIKQKAKEFKNDLGGTELDIIHWL